MKKQTSFKELILHSSIDSFMDLQDKVIEKIQFEIAHKPLSVKKTIEEIKSWARSHKNPEVRYSINNLNSFFELLLNSQNSPPQIPHPLTPEHDARSHR